MKPKTLIRPAMGTFSRWEKASLDLAKTEPSVNAVPFCQGNPKLLPLLGERIQVRANLFHTFYWLFICVCPGRLLLAVFLLAAPDIHTSGQTNKPSEVVDTSALRGKIMCGYQGWFRCPSDASGMGWIHWSRDSKRIAPDLLSFEMWPDMGDYPAAERYSAPGFTYPDTRPAELFSSDNAATVLRHFEWMRDYGIDGAWLQHFLVDLPGGQQPERYASRRRVLGHVRAAASQTGRAWALSYDIAAMPTDRIFDVLTADWKKTVEEGITADTRYLHHEGKPVVQIWGFYYNNRYNAMTPALALRLMDFFNAPGCFQAFLTGGGDWNWRSNPDPEWRKFYRRFSAYCPWNVGNYTVDKEGVKHASTQYWAEDKRDFESRGALWIPVIYPGFSWDNLQRLAPGTSAILRRKGRFLWEQFHELSKLGVDSVYVAMFDEVDEGTAIFKVTSSPPVQGHFLGYEGMPSDWYLRLTGKGARMLAGKQPVPLEIPIQP